MRKIKELYKELYEVIDDTMVISHEITGYIVEIAKTDLAGKKIIEQDKDGKEKRRNIDIKDVEENKRIRILFERLQEQYRKIQEKVAEISKKQYEEEESQAEMGRIISTSSRDEREYEEENIQDILEYIETSYVEMRYIREYEVDENNEVITYPSIYDDKPYSLIHDAEYSFQRDTIKNIGDRLSFDERISNFNFREKAKILDDIAKKKFLKELAMKHIESYIKDFKKTKSIMEPDEYKEIYRKLYEAKYVLIYEYLFNKYNGVVQVNDIGKIGDLEDTMEISMAISLGMQEEELKDSIALRIEECVEELQDVVYEIEESKDKNKDEEKKEKEEKDENNGENPKEENKEQKNKEKVKEEKEK